MVFGFDGKQPVVGTPDTCVGETARVIGDAGIGNRCYIGQGAIKIGNTVRSAGENWCAMSASARRILTDSGRTQ